MKFIGMICYFAGFEILRRRERKTDQHEENSEEQNTKETEVDFRNCSLTKRSSNITEAENKIEACNVSLASTAL